jgi:SynChlorMet cassette radical SAM/SPASM protein ScmE
MTNDVSMKSMRTPRSVDLEITGRCNLSCKYCSHFAGDDVGSQLSKAEWLTFFEELGRCSVLEVCLLGGEPFMRDDLQEIISGIIANRMRFSILTNGALITDKMAAFIKSTGRCNKIQVSIDGSSPRTHDIFRGEGSFNRAVQGLKLLIKHGIPATVRVTVHKMNVDDLEATARLLLEELGLPFFSTNSAGYLGACREHASEILLDTEDRRRSMEILFKLSLKYEGRIQASAGPLAEAKAWSEMEYVRNLGAQSALKKGYLTGCSGAQSKIGVKANGTLVPCVQLSGLELGRINEVDLKDVWQNHGELQRFRERYKISLRTFDYCRDCEFVDFCTGNCPALADSIVSDPYRPSPDGCYRRFLEEGGTIPEGIRRTNQGQARVAR